MHGALFFLCGGCEGPKLSLLSACNRYIANDVRCRSIFESACEGFYLAQLITHLHVLLATTLSILVSRV